MGDHRQRQARDSERRRIVGPVGHRSAGVALARLRVGLTMATTREASLKSQRHKSMRRRVVRIELQRLFEQGYGGLQILRHRRGEVRRGL